MKISWIKKQIVIVVTILLVTVLFQSCATMTDTDLTPEAATLAEVIEVPEMTKDSLYILANSWMVDTFVNAESVIEFSDKEAGIIKGKYVMTGLFEGVYSLDVRSTITIEAREGRVRITISDPYRKYTSAMGSPIYNASYELIRSKSYFEKACLPRYQTLIESFKSAMTTKEMTDF